MKIPRSVVVTGVSSGIGRAITDSLIKRDIRVFGSVRSEHDAERLRSVYKENVVPLIFDVTDAEGVALASRQVQDALGDEPLLGLVNNAGSGTAAPLLYVPIVEFREQLEVNVIGTLNVIQQFTHLLHTAGTKPGRIVNIGSTAGRIGIPFFGAYTASKHALNGLSESLRRELLIYGIDVITVVPGPVKTAIWDKADALDFSGYRDTPYAGLIEAFRDLMVKDGRSGMEPGVIGDAVFKALTSERPKPTYMRVAGRLKNWILPTMLPGRWVDTLMGKQLGLLPSGEQTSPMQKATSGLR
jgi:NAD(P)-dependent dehydrogenase (short-subunit alcohol dehydrogenase family)